VAIPFLKRPFKPISGNPSHNCDLPSCLEEEDRE